MNDTCDAAVTDDRFALTDVAQRTIELATWRLSCSSPTSAVGALMTHDVK